MAGSEVDRLIALGRARTRRSEIDRLIELGRARARLEMDRAHLARERAREVMPPTPVFETVEETRPPVDCDEAAPTVPGTLLAPQPEHEPEREPAWVRAPLPRPEAPVVRRPHDDVPPPEKRALFRKLFGET